MINFENQLNWRFGLRRYVYFKEKVNIRIYLKLGNRPIYWFYRGVNVSLLLKES